MNKYRYKDTDITITRPRLKNGHQVVWAVVNNGKQEYKVFADLNGNIEEKVLNEAEQRALLDCKKFIDMSEEEVKGQEEVVATEPVVEDPAEANACDSCQ
jgi:hypothetical protein